MENNNQRLAILCTLLVHLHMLHMMHNTFGQLCATCLKTFWRLLVPFWYLRAWKIVYNWLQCATIRLNALHAFYLHMGHNSTKIRWRF